MGHPLVINPEVECIYRAEFQMLQMNEMITNK